MKKKSMDVDMCENCDANEASYRVKFDEVELLLCSPCKQAYESGQEHPDAAIEAIGQEDGIDEDLFEDEPAPAEEDGAEDEE